MTIDERIERFFENFRIHPGQPRLSLRVNQSLQTIDWLAADDLSKGLGSDAQDEHPQAIWFLAQLTEVLGFSGDEAELFRRRLALRNRELRSRLGTHYSVMMRERGREYPNYCFLVHCDRKKIFMVNCVYQTGTLANDESVDFIDQPDGWEEVDRADYALGVGCIYSKFWADDVTAGTMGQSKAPVVLCDIRQTEGILSGRHVAVRDDIDPVWKVDANNQCFDPDDHTSHFDRTAVYYHVDRIQRYLRGIGLQVLDRFPALNPIQVRLTRRDGRLDSHYDSQEKCLYFRTIKNLPQPLEWTDARDARWIYHEYVHAVTHALAQFRRPTTPELERGRTLPMLQACAMDEGFADYFACSLAEQQGAHAPEFGELRWQDERQALVWEPLRRLSPAVAPSQNGLTSLLLAPQRIHEEWEAMQPKEPQRIYYRWAECWGRFLWRLRSPDICGVEIADTLVAHSLLFLTPWSDFAGGIWALVMADKRLFGGKHQQTILQASEMAVTQVTEPEHLDDLLGNLNIFDLAWSANAGDEGGLGFDLGEIWSVNQGQVNRQQYLFHHQPFD